MAAKKKRRAAKRKPPKARKAKVPPIPKGAHTVTAYMTVANCADALEQIST